MPAKKGKKERKFGVRELTREIWRHINPRDLLTYLQKEQPTGKWTMEGSGLISGLCPYHKETHPSFKINFQYGRAYCYGCQHVVTDIVSLIAKVTMKDHYYAYQSMLKAFPEAGKFLEEVGHNEVNESHRNNEVKKMGVVAWRKVYEAFVRDRPAYLSYMEPAFLYLTQGRGLDASIIPSLPVNIFPKFEHVKKYLPEGDSINRYQTFFEKYLDDRMAGSIIFHYNDTPNTISKFKVRRRGHDFNEVWKNYQATQNPMLIRNFFPSSGETFFMEDKYCADSGVFGLNFYAPLIASNLVTNVYITEGEFDALSVMKNHVEVKDFCILGMGGTAGSGLSFLREYGVQDIYAIPDSPAKEGNKVMYSWLKNPKNHEEGRDKPPLNYKVFIWPKPLPPTDLDDVANIMDYEAIKTYLYADKDSYFMDFRAWCKRRCEEEITAEVDNYSRDVEKYKEDKKEKGEEVSSDDAILESMKMEVDAEKYKIVRRWLECFHNRGEQDKFTVDCSASFGIDVQTIRSAVTGESTKGYTVEECIRRVSEYLKQYIEIPYYTPSMSVNGGGRGVYIWGKADRTLEVMPSGDPAVEKMLTTILGQNPYEWVVNVLGDDRIISSDEDAATKKSMFTLYQEKKSRALGVIKEGMGKILERVPQFDERYILSQGIHYKDIEKKPNDSVYFINGNFIAKGTPGEDGSLMKWTVINNATDNGIHFEVSPRARWSVVNDAAALTAGQSVDPKALYRDVDLCLSAWLFKNNDEVTRKFLAGWIMAVPIMVAIGEVCNLHLTGESTSGKTSFLQGLIGGGTAERPNHEVPYILEAACSVADITLAGIYQSMDRTTLLLCLDEAEAHNNSVDRQKQLAGLSTFIYSDSTGGYSVKRGSSGGKTSMYKVHVPICLAAISPNTDPTFANRIQYIETQRDPRRMNIATFFKMNGVDDEKVLQMRKDITTWGLHRIPDLMDRRQELTRELLNVKTEPLLMDDRYIQAVSGVLAVMEVCGVNPVEFYKELVAANANRLCDVSEIRNRNELLDAVFYTKSIAGKDMDGGTHMLYSPIECILDKDDKVMHLNISGCGVYYLPVPRWVVINWNQVKYSVFARMSGVPYGKWTIGEYTEEVKKNKHVVKVTDEIHNYVSKALGIIDVSSSATYTVVSDTYLTEINLGADEIAKRLEESLKLIMPASVAKTVASSGKGISAEGKRYNPF